MLTYDISERGNLTIYEYLYRCIKDDIIKGRLSLGEKLPSKRKMAQQHQISLKTVENAYEQLLMEDPDLSGEELSLKRFELIQDFLITGRDIPDQSYADSLCETLYAKLYDQE